MIILVESNDGTPDYWSFQNYEVLQLNESYQESYARTGNKPLVLYVPTADDVKEKTLELFGNYK